MALKTLTGTVSHFNQETVLIGSRQNRSGFGTIQSDKEINFRIDNKPVVLRLKQAVHLEDGEKATVAGKEKRGVFQAVAVRNDETGVVYALKTVPILLLGLFITGLSVPLFAALVGFITFPIGLWLLYKTYLNVAALRLLR